MSHGLRAFRTHVCAPPAHRKVTNSHEPVEPSWAYMTVLCVNQFWFIFSTCIHFENKGGTLFVRFPLIAYATMAHVQVIRLHDSEVKRVILSTGEHPSSSVKTAVPSSEIRSLHLTGATERRRTENTVQFT